MLLVDGAFAEAIDGDEDIIGGLCPAEWLWCGIDGIDIGFDSGFEFPGCFSVSRAKKRST
jgi:hypothetical protein